MNVFWLPKEGNSPEEYEDAFSHCAAERRFAVADGATESSFAELWAQSLVKKFTASPPDISSGGPLEGWVTPLQKEWHASINWSNLPWYAEEKARSGAFATFLGITFTGAPGQKKPGFFSRVFGFERADEVRYRALAVGDSNLFHIRDNLLHRSFPLEKAAEFDSRPLLLSSNPARNKDVWGEVKFADGDCKPNDIFIMATDAIAKWFLTQHESGAQPWRTLYSLKGSEDFQNLVGRARTQSLLKNDDTTIVIFKWLDTPNS